MMSTAVQTLVVHQPVACFDGAQGYRLEGDQAHLNAAVTVFAAACAGADWALQLWACEPAADAGLAGIKVAEVPLGQLAGSGVLEGWATALPPAGQRTHTMVLALASGQAECFDQIHDLAVFPLLENFRQPTLEGVVGYRFGPGSVALATAAVSNPRDAGNLSGSLVLELWALDKSYQGGAFEGVRIGSADLGCLAGQSRLEAVEVSVPADLVPAGIWQVVLMLREWTAAGYVTRDYTNFAEPLVVPERVAEEPAAPEVESAINAEASAPEAPVVSETKASEAAKSKAPEPAKAKKADKPVDAGKAAKPPKATEPANQTEPVKATESAKAAEPTKAVAPAKAASTEAGAVSINRASAGELAALKGVTKSMAAAIVAGRPYAALEDLLKVKGVGAKVVEKLGKQISL